MNELNQRYIIGGGERGKEGGRAGRGKEGERGGRARDDPEVHFWLHTTHLWSPQGTCT